MLELLLCLTLAAIAPKTGAAMCALTPADFQAAGVGGASKPTANISDGGASAYCTYAGKSSATGGIELDVFYPAGGGTVADAKETLRMALGEGGSLGAKPIKIAGADEALFTPSAASGGAPFASISVRKGTLVLSLGFPTSKNAQAQATKLAELALKRF